MNTDWSQLSPLQLGQFGEYYAKMEFDDVYTSEVDDHGGDFVAKDPNTGIFFEVQVKSLYKSNYSYISKKKLVLDERHLVCVLQFLQGQLPTVYVIPATAWNHPNAVLTDYEYTDLKSKPEWGIRLSEKNLPLIEKYKAEKYFQK